MSGGCELLFNQVSVWRGDFAPRTAARGFRVASGRGRRAVSRHWRQRAAGDLAPLVAARGFRAVDGSEQPRFPVFNVVAGAKLVGADARCRWRRENGPRRSETGLGWLSAIGGVGRPEWRPARAMPGAGCRPRSPMWCSCRRSGTRGRGSRAAALHESARAPARVPRPNEGPGGWWVRP